MPLQVHGFDTRIEQNEPNVPSESGSSAAGSSTQVSPKYTFHEVMMARTEMSHRRCLRGVDIRTGLLDGHVPEAAESSGPLRQVSEATKRPAAEGGGRPQLAGFVHNTVTGGVATATAESMRGVLSGALSLTIGDSGCRFSGFNAQTFRAKEDAVLEPMFTKLDKMAKDLGPRVVHGETSELSRAYTMYYFAASRLPLILNAVSRLGKTFLLILQDFDYLGFQFLHATREARLLVTAYAMAAHKILSSSEGMTFAKLGIPEVDLIQVGNSIRATLVDAAELVLCPPVVPSTLEGPVFRMAQVSRQVKFDELIGSVRHSVRISLLGELFVSGL